MNFDQFFSAFGFFGTDIGDLGGSLALRLTDEFGNLSYINAGNTIGGADGSTLYFGFLDRTTRYTQVLLTNNNGNDQFSYDDFSIGTPGAVNSVPEPASWAMMVAGFGLVGAMTRRRGSHVVTA